MNISDWKLNQMNVNYVIILENFTYSKTENMVFVWNAIAIILKIKNYSYSSRNNQRLRVVTNHGFFVLEHCKWKYALFILSLVDPWSFVNKIWHDFYTSSGLVAEFMYDQQQHSGCVQLGHSNGELLSRHSFDVQLQTVHFICWIIEISIKKIDSLIFCIEVELKKGTRLRCGRSL